MKKALISLGALVLSGAVLASCSFGGGVPKIKAPKKGKAVLKQDQQICPGWRRNTRTG